MSNAKEQEELEKRQKIMNAELSSLGSAADDSDDEIEMSKDKGKQPSEAASDNYSDDDMDDMDLSMSMGKKAPPV